MLTSVFFSSLLTSTFSLTKFIISLALFSMVLFSFEPSSIRLFLFSLSLKASLTLKILLGIKCLSSSK